MRNGLGWLLTGIISLVFLAVPAYGQSTASLYGQRTTLSLTPYFEYFFEPGKTLTFEQMREQEYRFSRVDTPNSNYGFNEHGLWLRASLDNLTEISEWAVDINYAQHDSVDFYLIRQQTQELVASSQQGKYDSDRTFRLPVFNITLPVSDPHTLYVRVQGHSSSLIVPAHLRNDASHHMLLQIDNMAWGMFYGGLLILAVFSAFMLFNLRDISLLAFIVHIAAVLIWQLTWGGHLQLFTNMAVLNGLIRQPELVFIAMSILSGLFTMAFLNSWMTARLMHWVIVFFLVIQACFGLVNWLDVLSPENSYKLIYGVGLLSVLVYVLAGCEAYLQQFKPALYLVIAWFILGVSAVVSFSSVIGIVPTTIYTSYIFQVGVFLQAGLFAIALTEKNRTQLQQEVDQASGDLRNNMELIEEQNVRLDLARKDAIKASNIKSQFLANMSHEIRTPLNAVLGFSRELEQAHLSAEQHEQVRVINSAADNLLTIVNDVLDFSKIEAGKLSINNQPFAPLFLFEEMVAIMAKSAHSKGLDFVFFPGDLPEKLISDAVRIKQVLTNLIGNALKFTSHGYICVHVKAHRRPHGVWDLQFVITDTGIGISRQDRKKLFSAFSQVDDALNRSYQGTGLGLVISQELVRLMNGALEFQSQPKIGSEFSVTLRTTQVSQRNKSALRDQWHSRRVVIFDPFPLSRRATASMLKNMGAIVSSVDSLDYLRQLSFEPDYLMVCLPKNSRYNPSTCLHCAMTMKAKNRVVWYSAHDPLRTSPLFTQAFSSSHRLPTTPSRLTSMLEGRDKPLRSIVNETSKAFPEAAVLAVDDMAMNLMLLETWFANSKVSLTLAYSGPEAIEHAQARAFDIILMDVQMPGMDGLQASKAIRKTDLNKGTPIIAVTAHAFKEEQERLLASGMDDYLPKPIEYDALVHLMRQWCHDPEKDSQTNTGIIDWQLALQRAKNDASISHYMLQEFVNLLPSARDTLQRTAHAHHFEALQQEVHRLHGASCYTGAPLIQTLSEELERGLKNQRHDDVSQQVQSLCAAIDDFMEQARVLLAENRSPASSV